LLRASKKKKKEGMEGRAFAKKGKRRPRKKRPKGKAPAKEGGEGDENHLLQKEARKEEFTLPGEGEEETGVSKSVEEQTKKHNRLPFEKRESASGGSHWKEGIQKKEISIKKKGE